MQSNRRWRCFESAGSLMILGFAITSAHAAPITIPGYTVTDLGAGTPTFSTDASGNGVLNAPNGQVYAFPQTPNSVLTPGQGIAANFPVLGAAPVADSNTYGNPANAFNYIQSAVMNANGVVVAIDDSGVNGHYGTGSVYVVQLNANGSWGPSMAVWSGNEQFIISSNIYIHANLVTGVNNLNQVLGTIGIDPLYGQATNVVLYNVNSHSLTDLDTLFYKSAAGGIYQSKGDYVINQPIALDDDGRILLGATRFDPNDGLTPTTLLLTPDGLSSDPSRGPRPRARCAGHRPPGDRWLRCAPAPGASSSFLKGIKPGVRLMLCYQYKSCRSLFLPNRDKRAIMVLDSVD